MKLAAALISAFMYFAAHAQEVNKDLLDRARAAITKDLLDPYSAVIENVRLVPSAKGSSVICGTINAKNRMGGYVGRQPFLYIDGQSGSKGLGIIGGTSPSNWRDVVAKECGKS